MSENDTGAQSVPAEGGGRKSLNDRVGHIGNAFRELKQAPVLAVVIAISGFTGTLLLGELFSDVYGQMNPLGIEDRAEMLTEDLMRKSENIEGKVVEITDLLLEMQAGDVQDPELLQAKISELLESIDGIRPDLSEVVSLRSDMFLVTALQKDFDIEMANMSPIADVVIKMNDGVTLCKERYTLATSHNGNPRTIIPGISLVAPTGEREVAPTASNGTMLEIENDLGRIVVAYRSHNIIANEAYYGFDVTCPA